jgi:gas vesicle protein
VADAAQRWEPTVAGGTGTGEVQDTARDKAEELKDTVRESSTQLSSTARGWMQQEADQRTTAIASQARTIADAMRQTSSKLTDDGQSQAALVTDTVAERVEHLAGYLEQTDGERLMNDVQDLARRNPWAFAAAGLVAGFAASRFMKASRSNQLSSSAGTLPDYRTSGTYGTDRGAYGASGAYGTTGTSGTTGTTGTGTGTTGAGSTGDYGSSGTTGTLPPTYETGGTYGETGSTGS